MNLQDKIVDWMQARGPVTFDEVCDFHTDHLANDIFEAMFNLLENKKISRMRIGKKSGYTLTSKA